MLILAFSAALFLLSCSGNDSSTNPSNHPPEIQSITADPPSLAMNDTTTLICLADDADGDNLYYVWSSASGNFLGVNGNIGDTVSWKAPSAAGSYWVVLTAYDDVSNDKDSLEIVVGIFNDPPVPPVNPSPENNTDSVSIYTDLTWECSDPDGDTLTYDVYFENSSTPQMQVSGMSGTTYHPGVLQVSATYYWLIVAHDGHGHSATSEVWKFTTGVPDNYRPEEPSNPSPGDMATGISITPNLTWTCSDPENDALTYDVYFGISEEPPLLVSTLSDNQYSPGTLDINTVYYWRIAAHDDQGNTTEGPLWQFTTSALYTIIGTCDTGDARSVAVNGNYAYVADYNTSQLTVIDVTDRTAPFVAGSCGVPGAFDVAIYISPQQDAYVLVAAREWGLSVVDISDPTNPVVVGSCDTHDAYSVTVGPSGNAYVGDNEDGLKIISLSPDPANPVIIKSCDTDNAKDVAVSQQALKAYVADGSAGLKIIQTNLSTADEAVVIGELNPGINNADGIAYKYAGIGQTYAVAADWGGVGDSGLKTVDVNNAASPFVFGFCATYNANDVRLSGDFGYISDSPQGLKIIDISDLSNPVQVGSCDTFQARGVAVSGNYAYVADSEEGLKIILINE